MRRSVTPDVEALCVECYAQTGEHCSTARLIFGNDIPPTLQVRCDSARAAWLRENKEAAR